MFIEFRDDEAFQHVYHQDETDNYYLDNESSGQYSENQAGSGEWHPFHEHRHLSDFVEYELFQVTDLSKGSMSSVGKGEKHGYCPFSQQIFDWEFTGQGHQYASFLSVGKYCDNFLSLESGWGDIYRWQRPGQYVSYQTIAEPDGTIPAGFYVIRVTIDPLNWIRETNDADNVGYALIQVFDDDDSDTKIIVECEKGLGPSPWDPGKTISPDRTAWVPLIDNPSFVAPTCDL